MLGIVAPVGSTISTVDGVAVSAINVCAVPSINVGVPIKVVVVVDGDVVATPAAAVSPTTSPKRTHGYSNAERDGDPSGVVTGRRISYRRIWIRRRSIYDGRIVRGYVDDLWVGLFDNDDALVLDDFGFHFLLLGRLQIAFVLGFLAHALHCIHYVTLLRQKGVAQVRSPLNVTRKALHYFGETCESLNTWVPWLLRDSVGQFFVL